MEQTQNIRVAYEALDSRARTARRAGWLSVGLIIATVFPLVVFFFGIFSPRSSIYVEKEQPLGVSAGTAPQSESPEIVKMRL